MFEELNLKFQLLVSVLFNWEDALELGQVSRLCKFLNDLAACHDIRVLCSDF